MGDQAAPTAADIEDEDELSAGSYNENKVTEM